MRTSIAALAAGVLLVAGVAACAAFDPGNSQQAAAQCWWLSNVTNRWEPMPEVQAREQCYELDSCSGGLGMSGGGCYKWTTSAEAPQNAW